LTYFAPALNIPKEPVKEDIKITVDVSKQTITAVSVQSGNVVMSALVSTAKSGIGCIADSYCTPIGLHHVEIMIGEGEPVGTIFKARKKVGLWKSEKIAEDLILSRILWLAGDESHNFNTFRRYIYIHGTNREDLIGIPDSHGCIRMLNKDVISLFALAKKGTPVYIN